MKIEKVNTIYYKDFEKLILDTYGIYIDIQAGEFSNDSFIEFEIKDLSEKYIRNIAEEIKEWMKNPTGFYNLELIGCDLAIKGLLEIGSYLIKIWW